MAGNKKGEGKDMAESLKSSKNEADTEKISKKKKKWSKYKIVSLAIIILLLTAGVCVYSKLNSRNDSAVSAAFNNDEVMRINGQSVGMNEFLLYAADVYQGYNLQKEADWDKKITESGNKTVTFEEQVKGTICEQIRMTKVLCMKAQDTGLSLSDGEKKILLENAQTYYKDLTSANVIDKALTVELIVKFYEENALAQKVYNSIIEGYDDNHNTSVKDTKEKGLTEKESYFIEAYHNLADKYDKNYDYNTSINWDLLEQLSFSKLSEKDAAKSDTAATATK